MQNYKKIYLNYFGYGEQDFIICEACQNEAVDVHHIYGRGEGKDEIKNLIALCRKCHDRAHSSKNYVSPDEFQLIHNYFLQGSRKVFLK
jgi:predicted restriction endonuclease